MLQPPPYQRVECAQRHDGHEQGDEKRSDHVVTEKVSQGVCRRHSYDRLLPGKGREFLFRGENVPDRQRGNSKTSFPPEDEREVDEFEHIFGGLDWSQLEEPGEVD